MDIQMPQSTSQITLRMILIASPPRGFPASSRWPQVIKGARQARPASAAVGWVARVRPSRPGLPIVALARHRVQIVPLPMLTAVNRSDPADVIDVSRLAEPPRHKEP